MVMEFETARSLINFTIKEHEIKFHNKQGVISRGIYNDQIEVDELIDLVYKENYTNGKKFRKSDLRTVTKCIVYEIGEAFDNGDADVWTKAEVLL